MVPPSRQIQDAISVNSAAEDLFVQLFCETFGPDKADELFVQYPFVDIYGRHRFIDFALETPAEKVAFEIDGETYHNPNKVSAEKYVDDLLKQNSLVFKDWRVYRWAYRQLLDTPDRVKDELATFLSNILALSSPSFLPEQTGQIVQYRDYQEEALHNLWQVRDSGDSIALLYHATGVGKTITAAADAKRVGGKTLFLVNALKLAEQAAEHFHAVWPEASTGFFTGSQKTDSGAENVDVLFATMQSVTRHLEEFAPTQFDYIIIDECHHAASKSYAAIMGYFRPAFTLGLSATPERADGEDILRIFKNVAHKMDLETAVKRGILAPIRCFRVKTNVDLSDVRINGIRYNNLDLESRLFVPERNQLIVDSYLQYAKGHNTVIFCASVRHAEDIKVLLQAAGVQAEAVSGRQPETTRNAILQRYETGELAVLCACDLLNEGWDSPKTDVLFMARPTMSRTIYLQQLGRGVRKHAGKESLLVFDFVDNANLFNMPYSLHRLLNMGQYRPFGFALAPDQTRKMDEDLFRKGERPEALIDLPVYATDYEPIELFNWQAQARSMVSQLEFVRRVDVQSETVERYIKEGKIKADLAVPISENRTLNYFKPETIANYAQKFGWEIIDAKNIKRKFIEFVRKMDMSYSYKPVLLLAFLDLMDENGRANIDEIVAFFKNFYQERRKAGKPVEKANSIFTRTEVSDAESKKNILRNPLKRFADMRFLSYSNDFACIELHRAILRHFTAEDAAEIRQICHAKLEQYYARFS